MAIKDKIQHTSVSRFESANAEIVRSITQRGLLHKWLRLYDTGKTVPAFDDFAAEVDIDNTPDLGSFTIKPQKSGPPLIVVDIAGRRILDAYGTADNDSGDGDQDLAVCLDNRLRPVIMPAYYECIARQLPVYVILKVKDQRGRGVDFERLLMPLTEGGHLKRIVTSVEAISTEGRFEIMNLLSASDRLANEITAVIDRDLFHRRPGPIPNNDPIEFG
ncbi:MAG: hypothetical protein K2X60_13335 [Xanthobacteraceae bacterium]|nr:hypothetical protein [Xanthobacteraceae bacterium]